MVTIIHVHLIIHTTVTKRVRENVGFHIEVVLSMLVRGQLPEAATIQGIPYTKGRMKSASHQIQGRFLTHL